MSADQDRNFIRAFAAVVGILAGFAVVFVIIARVLAVAAAPDEMPPAQVARIAERTDPVFIVTTDPAKLQPVAMTQGKGGASEAKPALSGAQVYEQVCAVCHAAGIAGSPKLGDAAAWAPHLAKGTDTLYKHAIHGFKAMPAKGGNPALSDAEVKKAVDYMVQQSGG